MSLNIQIVEAVLVFDMSTSSAYRSITTSVILLLVEVLLLQSSFYSSTMLEIIFKKLFCILVCSYVVRLSILLFFNPYIRSTIRSDELLVHY
jgi:hypothetical protein